MPGMSFTTTYSGLSNVLKNEVLIAAYPYDGAIPPPKKWVALWDTGANCSVITHDVVTALDLKPVTVRRAATPSGVYDAPCYLIELFLPNRVRIPNLLVMEGQPAGCDILIGMDVIGKGDFAVSNYNNQTSFSFRLPSCDSIDFVKHSYLKPAKAAVLPGRNEPCPCGSGKKYKNCCGK